MMLTIMMMTMVAMMMMIMMIIIIIYEYDNNKYEYDNYNYTNNYNNNNNNKYEYDNYNYTNLLYYKAKCLCVCAFAPSWTLHANRLTQAHNIYIDYRVTFSWSSEHIFNFLRFVIQKLRVF